MGWVWAGGKQGLRDGWEKENSEMERNRQGDGREMAKRWERS